MRPTKGHKKRTDVDLTGVETCCNVVGTRILFL
jgi:hypothetical protein